MFCLSHFETDNGVIMTDYLIQTWDLVILSGVLMGPGDSKSGVLIGPGDPVRSAYGTW